MNAVRPHIQVVSGDVNLLERTLAIVRALSSELHPEMPGLEKLDAKASMERDFGLDSLARVELALRIEQACGMHVPEVALAESDTIEELVRALVSTQGAAPVSVQRRIPRGPAPARRPCPGR